jgi:hypothetical protein
MNFKKISVLLPIIAGAVFFALWTCTRRARRVCRNAGQTNRAGSW